MPLLDGLPPWPYFALPACVVASLGLGLFLFARKRGPRVGAPAVALAFALALGVFASISAAERRQSFAVLWAQELRTIPSAKSELRISVVRGTTARLGGSFGSFERVILADGVEGWTPRDTLFLY